jgi:two-component system phosphate regulon response regulator OmpR
MGEGTRVGTRILVVEDEADLRRSVAEYLALHGFEVREAESGAAFDRRFAEGGADLVLLDLRLPGEDGLSILKRLRRAGATPVIMVTAMGEPVDRIVGLELGADDYVAKPFELRELIARIRTVLRRARPEAPPAAPSPEARTSAAARALTRVGRAWLDREARRLIGEDGAETPLTAMEFELLTVFLDRPNRVLSRDQLLDLAHDGDWEPFDRSIDIRVARLRKKIEPDPAQPTTIRTVRGAGYMFTP